VTQAKPWDQSHRTTNILTLSNKDRLMNISSIPTANSGLPTYGSKPQKQGLYLGLFHGRASPADQMSGWGCDGPTIGPLKWCHTTYAFDIKIEFERAADALDYFGLEQKQFELEIDGDLLVFQGIYYGDWTVYYVNSDDCERPADTFRDTSRVNRLFAHRKFFL
jgi:hypothetical protein